MESTGVDLPKLREEGGDQRLGRVEQLWGEGDGTKPQSNRRRSAGVTCTAWARLYFYFRDKNK
jgi:hypothetical protein